MEKAPQSEKIRSERSNFSKLNYLLFLVLPNIVSLVNAGILAQEQYADPNTKEPLGTRDYLMTGTDQRIPVSPPKEKQREYEFDVNEGFKMDIGAGAWGAIQVSALISEKPSPFTALPQFCSVTGETTTHPLVSYLTFTDRSRIVDYESDGDIVFLMTSSKLLSCIRVTNIENTILSTQWITSGLTTLIGDVFTGEAQNVGLGYEKDTGFLYVPSANGLFRVSQKDRSIKKVAEGVFQPFGDIVYTDCVKGVLVVAFRNQGVFAYDVSNPESIKLLAVFNASFFASQISNQTTLKFTFFVIQSHLVQVAAESDRYKIPNDLIGNSLYNYTDILLRKDQSFELLVVSTNQGILFVDVSQMLGNARVAPTTPLPRKININNTVQLARFQNTLSILEQDPTQETPNEPVDSPNYRSGSTVTEILLTANDVSQWTNTAVASNLIFQINRAGVFPYKIKSVFTDAQYMYLIAESKIINFPRGVQSQYDEVILNVANNIFEPQAYGVISMMYSNVRNMALLTFGDIRVAAYNLMFSGPTLSCGTGNQKAIPGTYKIKLNATTRDCPQKASGFPDSSTMSYRNKVLNPCNWQIEIVLGASLSWFDGPKTTAGWIILWVAVGIFGLVLVMAIVFMCRSRNLKKQKEELEAEIKSLNSRPVNDEQKSFKQDPLGIVPDIHMRVNLPQTAVDAEKLSSPTPNVFDDKPPLRSQTGDNLNDTLDGKEDEEPPNYQDEGDIEDRPKKKNRSNKTKLNPGA